MPANAGARAPNHGSGFDSSYSFSSGSGSGDSSSRGGGSVDRSLLQTPDYNSVDPLAFSL